MAGKSQMAQKASGVNLFKSGEQPRFFVRAEAGLAGSCCARFAALWLKFVRRDIDIYTIYQPHAINFFQGRCKVSREAT